MGSVPHAVKRTKFFDMWLDVSCMQPREMDDEEENFGSKRDIGESGTDRQTEGRYVGEGS